MLFPDYHFHTDFSSDCDEPMQAVIASAKEKGLSALCVTDHYDMDFPVRPEEPDVDFDLDLDSYYRTYHALSEKLVPEFDLRVGVELGVMPSTTKKLNTFVQAHPELDFIICSLHVVDGMDPYYPEYFEGKDISCATERRRQIFLISAIMQISLKSCFRFLSPVVRVLRSIPEAYTAVSPSRILIQIS